MKSINYLVLFVFALALTVTSCKKDNATKSNKDILTSKSWKISSMKINGVAWTVDACSKDDIIIFATNGTFTNNPGAIKCDPNETTTTDSWSLSDDGKYLTIGGVQSPNLVISESQLVFTITQGTDSIEVTLIPA